MRLSETFNHNNQFLYHTTNMRNYDDIMKHGLLPNFGDTVKQAYGGYYSLDNNQNKNDGDDELIKLDFDGLLFFSEYPMLGYSQTMKQNFKLNEALVCVVRKNNTIYHKVSDYPKFTDYRGQQVDSIDYNSVYDLPIIIETGDWFSFQEQTPIMLLEGRYIIEFMKKNFPDELNRYMNENTKDMIKQMLHERLFVKGSEPQVDVVNHFIKFAAKELGVKEPKVIIQFNRKGLTTTAAYGDKRINVYAKDRALVDVLRSIAHEMTHLKQDVENRLKDTNHEQDNAAGSPIENEANARAGEIIRKFGKKYPQIYE